MLHGKHLEHLNRVHAIAGSRFLFFLSLKKTRIQGHINCIAKEIKCSVFTINVNKSMPCSFHYGIRNMPCSFRYACRGLSVAYVVVFPLRMPWSFRYGIRPFPGCFVLPKNCGVLVTEAYL
jgi:hypothetical protein